MAFCDDIDVSSILLAQINNETDEAKMKELENWIDQNVYVEVNDNGQDAISVRWVVTPKLIDGQWKIKARLVARGFEEDPTQFRTDSPTCMRETLKIAFAVIASKKWLINSIDIKAAFLQGKEIERKVFLRPPKEANCHEKLWLLKKVVYGLSDASRVWYLRVLEELTKLGVTVSKYDKALFIWKFEDSVQGIILVHVDDFLWSGTSKFQTQVIKPLKDIFTISKESDCSFKYVGINIEQKISFLSINQNKYINSIKAIEINNAAQTDRKADKLEKRNYRALVGQLNWSCGVSRPDMAFSACQLSTQQASPKVEDLMKANRVVNELQRENVQINYIPLNLSSVKLAVFADASYKLPENYDYDYSGFCPSPQFIIILAGGYSCPVKGAKYCKH